LPEISRELLMRTIGGERVQRVQVDASGGAFVYRFDDLDVPHVEAVAHG
jgi:type VI secretion system protein VasG